MNGLLKALLILVMVIALFVPVVIGAMNVLSNADQIPDVDSSQGNEEVKLNLALSDSTLAFNIGAERKITATMDAEVGSYIFQWKSSDESVASVKKDAEEQSACVITGVGKGNATVTLSIIDVSKFKVIDSISCEVTVISDTITFGEEEVIISLDQGNTATVTAEAPEGGEITWSTSDESIATVEGGVITAHKAGQVYIIAKSGNVEGKLLVKIYNSLFTLESVHIVSVGGSAEQIKVNGSIEGKAIWTSGDDRIATVDENGNVTGVKVGMTTITATSEVDGLSSKCVVIVKAGTSDPTELIEGKKAAAAKDPGNWYYLLENLETVAVSETPTLDNGVIHMNITAIGTSGANFFYLRYQPDDIGDVIYKNTTYIYSSEDNALIQINGKDHYLKAGLNRIELEFTSSSPKDGNPYQFKWKAMGEYYIIPVFEEIGRIEKMILSSDSITLNTTDNKTALITVTVPGQDAPVIEWVSSNEDVATVVDGVVTAVGEGNSMITAVCGNLSATCLVTVEGSTPLEGTELKSGNKSATLASPGQWFYLKDGKSVLYYTPIMDEDGNIHLGVEAVDTANKKYVYLRYQPETLDKEYKVTVTIEFAGADGTAVDVSGGNVGATPQILNNGTNTFEFTFTADDKAPLQFKFYGAGSYVVNVTFGDN